MRRLSWLRGRNRIAALVALGAMSIVSWVALGAASISNSPQPPSRLSYVPDRVCRDCHTEIWKSYQEVGMAKSFARPENAVRIESFSNEPFFHAPSKQYFQISSRGDRGGGLVFRRWQKSETGAVVHEFEQKIDWVLGSGHRSRTYLYRMPDGALFQLPLAWYSQEAKWGMAPGFDRPDHEGVTRKVRRECLFCHNAYPEMPEGADAHGMPQVFPAELPEGTGCQRCHGPGGEHVARAAGGGDLPENVRAAIVNPARLAPAERDDVCNQCHLQPAVALAGPRRSGRGDFSFRPGERLVDYQVHVDIDEDEGGHVDRFEINHHAYRLRQSPCFLASGGKLSCLTCHDPHRKIPVANRADHYRTACLSCHGETSERRPKHGIAASTFLDCVACHMPPRRPRDVVHVVMTDHRIRRRPGGAELLAPRNESDPIPTTVRVYEPSKATPEVAEISRALAVANTGVSSAAVDRLESLLATSTDAPLRLELAIAQLRQRRYGAAERTLEAIRPIDSEVPKSSRWLEAMATAEEGLGKLASAEARYRSALARSEVEWAETATRLARLLARQGRHSEAVVMLLEAVDRRPNLVAAWVSLGTSLMRLDRNQEATTAYERALAIDPQLAAIQKELERLRPPSSP